MVILPDKRKEVNYYGSSKLYSNYMVEKDSGRP